MTRWRSGLLLGGLFATVAGAVWGQPLPGYVPPVPLAASAIPTTRSDLPKRSEWSEAQPIEVKSRTTKGRACTARRLREYVKVRCPFPTAGIRQFTGDTKDVELFVTPKPEHDVFGGPHGGEIIFPLRKESGYLFQFFEIAESYEGFGVSEGVWVDVSWPASRDVPTVVIR